MQLIMPILGEESIHECLCIVIHIEPTEAFLILCEDFNMVNLRKDPIWV